jgi:enoyl-CoA hydratase/carnithine racemase
VVQSEVETKSGFLHVRSVNGVAFVSICRQERKNAMNQAMWQEMTAIFSALGQDASVRVIVLFGEGADFCAGADISEFDTVRGDADSARRYEADNSATFAAIRNCPVPTIAAIKGICFGGGFGMAAACDIRIGHPSARFSAMVDIVNALGPQMAKYLAYTAARIDAEAALKAGFLMEIVDEGFGARIDEIALTIAQNAPLSVKASKAAISATLCGDSEALQAATALGDATFESADYAEGRAAFRDKRAPVFSGN